MQNMVSVILLNYNIKSMLKCKHLGLILTYLDKSVLNERIIAEPSYEETNNLHRRKQRRRSAVQ